MKILKVFLKILLLLSLLVYPLFINFFGGAGLVSGAMNNFHSGFSGDEIFRRFLVLGFMMLASSVIMTAATVMSFCKKNISAVITDLIGTALCMFVLFVLRKTAMEAGLSNDEFKPYADIYTERHLPTVVHFIILAILSFIEYLSYDSINDRRIKKNNKYSEDSEILM